MKNRDYMLTIRIPMTCMDDIDARLKAKRLKSNIDMVIENDEMKTKLQEIYRDKEPRGL